CSRLLQLNGLPDDRRMAGNLHINRRSHARARDPNDPYTSIVFVMNIEWTSAISGTSSNEEVKRVVLHSSRDVSCTNHDTGVKDSLEDKVVGIAFGIWNYSDCGC